MSLFVVFFVFLAALTPNATKTEEDKVLVLQGCGVGLVLVLALPQWTPWILF